MPPKVFFNLRKITINNDQAPTIIYYSDCIYSICLNKICFNINRFIVNMLACKQCWYRNSSNNFYASEIQREAVPTQLNYCVT